MKDIQINVEQSYHATYNWGLKKNCWLQCAKQTRTFTVIWNIISIPACYQPAILDCMHFENPQMQSV